ncbi:hypothetical protein EOL96_00920 [Candidatus Saccharibacteria bacterium]|nr:hypothetical protein [Candidatus Saccharibacteria bacterium]
MGHVQTRYIVTASIAAAFLCAATYSLAIATTPISQGYITDEPIPVGSIVSLKNNSNDYIVPSQTSNSDNIIGVVVNDGSSPLTLNTGLANQAQVATGGVVPVIVSDVNGEILQGDPITASYIMGVGMKATSNSKVVGIAQGAMTNISKQTAKDDKGEEQTVTLGQVPVLVSVSYHYKQPDKTIIPAALQNIANTVAGKKVDSLPIIISAVIFVIMLITVVSIVYAMIRSSIISVGRNPMAQSAVYRDIIQLSVLVLAIIGVSIVAIYIVLTRL